MTQTPDTNPTPPPVGPVGPHNFTGLREWGLSPTQDRECVTCGVPWNRHPDVNIHTSHMQMHLDVIAAELAPLRDQLYLIAERLNLVTRAVPELGPDNPELDQDENQAVHLAQSLRALAQYARDVAERVTPA
jgi:hypothetical protein